VEGAGGQGSPALYRPLKQKRTFKSRPRKRKHEYHHHVAPGCRCSGKGVAIRGTTTNRTKSMSKNAYLLAWVEAAKTGVLKASSSHGWG